MMPTDQTVPDPTRVLELLNAFRQSKVMFAALSLGVFDALSSAPMGRTPAELASELHANEAALGRLLDACVGLELLAREGPRFRNQPVAQTYLVRTSPRRMTGYANYSDRVLWQLWNHLDDAIREGSHRWKQVYGWDGPIFSHFYSTPESKREFLMGMHGFGMISSPVVVNAVDLSPFQTLVDLGAATGHLTMAACQRWPHLKGVVFDLPEAIPLAEEMLRSSPAEVQSRIRTVPGDFFQDDLPAGDLYAVGRILHDWSLPKIERLLEKIFQSLPSGGGLLVVEKMLTDDRNGPPWALLQSLNMLVCTEGQERTLGEYAAIFEAAGFRDIVGVRTPAPCDAILARKP